ncbi:MAG: c-type cytochrome [Pseudobacteriovorax sp.]|nr:c-type cytochrome [Pseudobacteriovorax sp.]
MSKNKLDVERPFVVDGIKEYDNPLPSWWLVLFYGTIAFAVVYLIFVHIMDGPTLDDELMADRSAHTELVAAQESQNAGGNLAEDIKNPELIAEGKTQYVANCAACHGQAGEGLVGPNLTDKYWLHGGSPEAIMQSINDGIPEKGMIAWKAILGTQKVKAITGYIVSIQGSNPPNAKEPQGDEYAE